MRLFLAGISLILATSHAQTSFRIQTLAGSSLAGDGPNAAQAILQQLEGIAAAPDGTLYLADAASCVELVESGTAVALCQPTRILPGLVTVPLKDVPLRWIHMIGWRPDSVAAGFAGSVRASVEDAHRDLVARSQVYSTWLEHHAEFGIQA